MINLVVFILCAGEQKRFPPGMFKQTLQIDGEPLIERTIKQVRNLYQCEPWICVRSGQPFGLNMRYFYPDSYQYIFDTLASTSGQWGHTNIVLLGDVYYSENALMTIKTGAENFYGDYNEIYAVKFQRGEIVRLSRAISAARQDTQQGGTGKLWNVYRAWVGLPIREHRITENFNQLPDSDDTQDFDTIEDYQAFALKHLKVTA